MKIADIINNHYFAESIVNNQKACFSEKWATTELSVQPSRQKAGLPKLPSHSHGSRQGAPSLLTASDLGTGRAPESLCLLPGEWRANGRRAPGSVESELSRGRGKRELCPRHYRSRS